MATQHAIDQLKQHILEAEAIAAHQREVVRHWIGHIRIKVLAEKYLLDLEADIAAHREQLVQMIAA